MKYRSRPLLHLEQASVARMYLSLNPFTNAQRAFKGTQKASDVLEFCFRQLRQLSWNFRTNSNLADLIVLLGAPWSRKYFFLCMYQ